MTLDAKGYGPSLGTITFAGDISVLVPSERDNGSAIFENATVASEVGSLENVHLTTDRGAGHVVTRIKGTVDSPRLQKLERRLVVRVWEETFAQCWVETTPDGFDAVRTVLSSFLGTSSRDHVSSTPLLDDRSLATIATTPRTLLWLMPMIGGLLLALMWFAIDLASGTEQALYRLNGASITQVVATWVSTRFLSVSFGLCIYTSASVLSVNIFGTEGSRAAGMGVLAAVTCASIAISTYALSSFVRLALFRPVALLRSV